VTGWRLKLGELGYLAAGTIYLVNRPYHTPHHDNKSSNVMNEQVDLGR
jgi:hypothetical protein